MEHIHERCSSVRQGWKDTSSWILRYREEALKLASASGAGTVEWGQSGGKKGREGGSLVEEKECWKTGWGV